jgi:hypothetical protein
MQDDLLHGAPSFSGHLSLQGLYHKTRVVPIRKSGTGDVFGTWQKSKGLLQNDEAQKEEPASPERGWLAQSFALKLGCEENKNARPV